MNSGHDGEISKDADVSTDVGQFGKRDDSEWTPFDEVRHEQLDQQGKSMDQRAQSRLVGTSSGRSEPAADNRGDESSELSDESDVVDSRIARMRKGDRLGQYELVRTLRGGKSRDKWLARSDDGDFVFLKVLDEVQYRAGVSAEISSPLMRANELFEQWESHHRRVLDRLLETSIGDGALIVPMNQGRTNDGSRIYRVYPIVESELTPHRTVSRSGRAIEPSPAMNLSDAKPRGWERQERVRFVGSLFLALWQLHRRNLVHGDIKPGNVLLTESRVGFVARLIDFDNCYESGAPFAPALIGGDERYFSPERSEFEEGDGAGANLTCKSDIFSLGMMLHEKFSKQERLPKWTEGRLMFDDLGFGIPSLQRALERAVSSDPRQRPDIHELLCLSGIYVKKELGR